MSDDEQRVVVAGTEGCGLQKCWEMGSTAGGAQTILIK